MFSSDSKYGCISKAAEDVGMQQPNFHSLMRKYGITADDC